MDFTFSEDQQILTESIANFLRNEITAEGIRETWNTTGSDSRLWQQLVELGLPAMLVPEEFGGLGMNELDAIGILEVAGEVAFAEPLVEMLMVATPMLVKLAEHSGVCADLLQEMAQGEKRVAIGHPINPTIADAKIADWILLPRGGEVHLVPSDQASLVRQESVDPSRRLYTLAWDEDSNDYLVAKEHVGVELWREALNRGALACAAQLVGLAQGMINQSVAYTKDREQFGRAIGSNQAVKHLMANCAVNIEFARPTVHQAAYEVGFSASQANLAVSHAKVAASEAALLSARNSIQVHGAMGYTWECDLQIWAKRAWALSSWWGDLGFHKRRVHDWLLDQSNLLGAENTFSQCDF